MTAMGAIAGLQVRCASTSARAFGVYSLHGMEALHGMDV